MTTLALQSNLFSIVTTNDRTGDAPVWKKLLDWPDAGDHHVEYAAETTLQRNLWATRMDQAVLAADKPVLLIASGETCLATAWWARLSPANYVSKVAGALLFAPPRSVAAVSGGEQFASPDTHLPFPSAVVAKNSEQLALSLAESWGSGFIEGTQWRAVSNKGAWHQAQLALLRVTALVVERDLRVADALGLKR